MYGGWNWTVLGDVWRYGSAPELHGGWIGVVAPQCDIEGPAQMPPGSIAIFKATCEQPVSWELIENGAGANWCGGLGTDQVCVSAAMPGEFTLRAVYEGALLGSHFWGELTVTVQ